MPRFQPLSAADRNRSATPPPANPDSGLVRRARARLDEALDDHTPGHTPVPGHAASYLFALARQTYLELAEAARRESLSAMAELERVLTEPSLVLAMGLHPPDLVISIADPQRQARAFETLSLSVDELVDLRDRSWCADVSSQIDRRLLAAASAQRDAQLAMELCSSRDPVIAGEALALTGRALNRELARASKRPVDDPLRSAQRIARHVENLRQWLADVARRGDEGLARLASAVERRSMQSRIRAAQEIGAVILERADAHYEAPVRDVAQWARDRQQLLEAADEWRLQVAPGVIGIDLLVEAVHTERERLHANGVGWALESQAAITAATARLRKTVTLLTVGIGGVLCAAMVTLMVFGFRAAIFVPVLVIGGGTCAAMGWEIRELKQPGAWFGFYEHPATVETAADLPSQTGGSSKTSPG